MQVSCFLSFTDCHSCSSLTKLSFFSFILFLVIELSHRYIWLRDILSIEEMRVHRTSLTVFLVHCVTQLFIYTRPFSANSFLPDFYSIQSHAELLITWLVYRTLQSTALEPVMTVRMSIDVVARIHSAPPSISNTQKSTTNDANT